MKRSRWVIIVLAVLVGMQFVAAERSNPPVTAELAAPPDALAALRHGCYDCHSNATRWPWYSRIAPVSWWVARDVREAREQMNLSEWGNLSVSSQKALRQSIAAALRGDSMPPGSYRLMHCADMLTPAERDAVLMWADGVR